MVKKSIGTIFVLITLFIFNSCSNDRNKNKVDSYPPSISFNDQVELNIEDKYFTIKIDSAAEYFGIISSFEFRIEFTTPNVTRYWERRYNNMVEVRFHNDARNEKNGKSYNYLFGMKDFASFEGPELVKGFFIRWRNFLAKKNPNIKGLHPIITEDIGKYTVELETNLPPEIIKKYYPYVVCMIENKYPERAIVRKYNHAKIFFMDYYPFVKVPNKKDIRQ